MIWFDTFSRTIRRSTIIIVAAVVVCQCAIGAAKPFEIRVVDAQTSRGIPLAILTSNLHTIHVTDSNGLIAYDEPVAMGQDLFFKPLSDGYVFDAPGLAMGGVTFHVEAGSSATIVMRRRMIAERMYRITGAGIYRDTIALGMDAPISHPLLNAGVTGQDSTLCSVFGGRLFWIWGDTSHMRHPLGNFGATGAYSDLPTSGGLPVDRGINLHYFEKGEFVKAMVPSQPGDKSHVYWLSDLMTVPDRFGEEHLLAWCSNIDGPSMNTMHRRLMEFDPAENEFRSVVEIPISAPVQPGGHAVLVPDADGDGVDYQYFGAAGEPVRVLNTYEAVIDPLRYEALTCLDNGETLSTTTAHVSRDEQGRAVYQWRKNISPVGARQQSELVEAGLLKDNECLFRPVNAADAKPFRPHGGSLAYNKHRNKWTMILSEIYGTSVLGEVWYLEADRPEGPWINAVKVATHDKYTFYNPLQHPELVTDDDHYLYFEGTYTKTFSTVQTPTPWYDYNQIMYRIDLDDKRLSKDILDAKKSKCRAVIQKRK